MEKEAVAAWDQRRPRDKDHKTPESIGKEISENELQASNHQSLRARSDSEKGEAVLSNQFISWFLLEVYRIVFLDSTRLNFVINFLQLFHSTSVFLFPLLITVKQAYL